MLLDYSSASHVPNTFSNLQPTMLLIEGCMVFILFTLIIGGFALLRQKLQLVASQTKGLETSASNLASQSSAHSLQIRQMEADLAELQKRLRDHNEFSQVAAPLWAASEMPINLNRRGQIIRLSRKGKSIPEIAQDLNVAQGEVELLLKVHDLSQEKAEQGRS